MGCSFLCRFCQMGINYLCTVHPSREGSMDALPEKKHADHSLLDVLIQGKYIEKVRYGSNNTYIHTYHNSL